MELQHFLIVTFPLLSHVNPGRHLAALLSRATGARVTFSTAVSAHRQLFPSLSPPDREVDDGALLSYVPFSDGHDDGVCLDPDVFPLYMAQLRLMGSQSLSTVLDRLAARGRPVTCAIYTIFLSWVTDVARARGIPSAFYWIQPATVLAAYYHYFHGHAADITAHADDPNYAFALPGLQPLKIHDLPSFFVITSKDDPNKLHLDAFKETFDALMQQAHGGRRPKVLVNTFDSLEPDALRSVEHALDTIPIGPVLPFLLPSTEKEDNKKDAGGDKCTYLQWLGAKPARSVVYVSFGSFWVVRRSQMEEILKGLRASGRPFLWVVRGDNRGELAAEEGGGGLFGDLGEEEGVVVEWCDQVKVLSHPAVGCFVTHCGWNSTLESLACGVPTVGVPQWSDQGTNAWLAAEAWGTGVRAETGSRADGVMRAEELRRCVEAATGEGVRRAAEGWRERARAAVAEGGSSAGNLRAFGEEMVAGKETKGDRDRSVIGGTAKDNV